MYNVDILVIRFDRSSAADEMGDSFATIDVGRKLWTVPLFGEKGLGPHLTQRGLGLSLPPYQMAS